MISDRPVRHRCAVATLAFVAATQFVPARAVGQNNELYEDEFVLYGLDLEPNQDVWLTVAGNNLEEIEIQTRDSRTHRPLSEGDKWLQNYTDFRDSEESRPTFQVFHGTAPRFGSSRPLDIRVLARAGGQISKIVQCGLSDGTVAFKDALAEGSMARDEVVAVPRRFYAEEADRVLIVTYSELPGCSYLRITDTHGAVVYEDASWTYSDSRPVVLFWDGHQEIEPGEYQVSMLLRYSQTPSDCESLDRRSGADFILYSQFEILPPR